ncbi:MAG TPA: PaaI family thioesterase [Candidatus Scybalocola faecigallinarum]|uniref:PaaI family thioesterase n=1 Tax=Candidatus Scybalocola faecigallinarum TaxID=2840941 RepID=A0A9D1F527_9FIRM|nr:PaaI family thioesterase [Candidatus Scybalocola faecigallinarum]
MTKEELKARIESSGFAKHTGIELLEAENGTATGRIVLEPVHGNPIGSIHGGCIFTLVDTIAGTAFVTTGKSCTTLSANIDYLNAAIKSKVLIAKASPARIGNHIAVFDVRVTDDRDVLIARASVTFYVLKNM